jgi:hypothetical protein
MVFDAHERAFAFFRGALERAAEPAMPGTHAPTVEDQSKTIRNSMRPHFSVRAYRHPMSLFLSSTKTARPARAALSLSERINSRMRQRFHMYNTPIRILQFALHL